MKNSRNGDACKTVQRKEGEERSIENSAHVQFLQDNRDGSGFPVPGLTMSKKESLKPLLVILETLGIHYEKINTVMLLENYFTMKIFKLWLALVPLYIYGEIFKMISLIL